MDRRQQKRQRRMTAEVKAAAEAPPAAPYPAAAGAAATAAANNSSIADAWQEWLCPGHPALFAFLMQPQPDAFKDIMHSMHPAALFPEHYPHSLPPCAQMWSSHWMQLAAAAPPRPELRPATQAAADQRRPAGAAEQQGPAGAVEQQQGPAEAGRCAAGAAAASGGRASSSGGGEDELGEEDDGGSSGLPSSSGGGCYCCCSECEWGQYSTCVSYYSASPESQRVQPGKRIMWRGAIERADPVRRNLFASIKAAASTPVSSTPASSQRPRQHQQPQPQQQQQQQPHGLLG